MALPDIECEIPRDACCGALYLVAERLLDISLAALQACEPEGICEEDRFHGYVSHGRRIEDPAPNYVVVSMLGIRPETAGRLDVNRAFPRFKVDYQVRLLESGWPMAQSDGERIWVPGHEMYHGLSLHSYSHGEAMFRALANAAAFGDIDGCEAVTLGNFVPIEPSGGTVGWEIPITVALPPPSPISGS